MKLTLRQIRVFILAICLLVLTGGTGYRLGQKQALSSATTKIKLERKVPAGKEGLDFNLFWEVWDKVEANFLGRKDIDRKEMVYGAISGMVASLGDPYTVFLPPEENEEAKDDLRGDFEGVGIQIGYKQSLKSQGDYNKEKRLSVIAPLSGTPAEAAGLKAGDLILKIVDEAQKVDRETTEIPLPEAVKLIRGPQGSLVKLTIQREGVEKPFEVSLKRSTIVVKSVEVKFSHSAKASRDKEEKVVAILKLSRFGERTYDEWEEAVEEIKNQEASSKNFAGVILDLRNNPGGFLQGAVFIGSEFLPSGTVVQQDLGVNGKENYPVNRQGELLKEPLIVLINAGSASASEIVAGALQEAKRAKVVGEKSFGKGTVQEAEDLAGGAGLHITIARWLLPSGRSIDQEGIKPDLEIEEDSTGAKDLPLEKAMELLTL
jgi:carboxyl-terminal processing protease